MRISVRRQGGRSTRARSTATTVVVAAALAFTAACGSSDGGSSGSSSDAKGSAGSKIDVDPAAVQETVNKAFQADVKLDSLPDTVQDAFARATLTLPQAKLDKAFECWKGASCTVGNGKVTLGIADGFGQNQWRKFSKMEIILQALTYPEVGKILSTDAQGDLATFQSNVRSLAAQGAKAIVTYDDFGPAALPAFTAASQQGAKIASYVGPVPDAPESAVAAQVHGDTCATGEDMADVATNDLKLSGDVAIFNGTPGNPQGQAWNKCFEDKIKGSGITVGKKLDTNWTPAGVYQAASALVSSGDDAKGIFYDYADPMPQIISAYEKAGKVTPALVTWTSNNGLFKEWQQRQGTDKAFELYFTNGLNWQGRAAVTAVMDLLAGKKVENQMIMPQPFVKAVKGVYDPKRPDDYPGPSVLVPDALISRMLQ
ncbi:substrate-binding domain-containing protein [Marmoricola sp. URHB0036]|uniref:substrate-binding domain-containing protein n=1 Tax=Marmoricola sp. URHB0036 TaxID=1298863 RepID=UPI0004867041|nr:substrate-binding domain-containing protein [Marmoricola sp. URHB0036]